MFTMGLIRYARLYDKNTPVCYVYSVLPTTDDASVHSLMHTCENKHQTNEFTGQRNSLLHTAIAYYGNKSITCM